MCFFRVGRNTHGRRFSLYFPYYLGETFFFWHFDRPIRVRLRKSAFIENGAESEGFFLFFLQICREHVYLIKKKKKNRNNTREKRRYVLWRKKTETPAY